MDKYNLQFLYEYFDLSMPQTHDWFGWAPLEKYAYGSMKFFRILSYFVVIRCCSNVFLSFGGNLALYDC